MQKENFYMLNQNNTKQNNTNQNNNYSKEETPIKEKSERLQATVQTEKNMRLDVFVASYWQEKFSRAKAQKYIQEKKVFVNEKIIGKPSFVLQENDVVAVEYSVPQTWQLEPNNMHIPILYQDEYLAIIHKPPMMTVHPGAGTKNDTLVHSLLAQMDSLSSGAIVSLQNSGIEQNNEQNNEAEKNIEQNNEQSNEKNNGTDKKNAEEIARPGIVHRLDRETEGLMIIAKTDHAHYRLAQMFEQRKIQKKYLAWVCAFPQNEQDTIEGYISRHPSRQSAQRKLMVFSEQPLHEKSKFASLAFQVQKKSFPFALLQIDLHTGRTHQIRVSFKSRQHPVVNDSLYGNKKFFQRHNIDKTLVQEMEKLGLLLAANSIAFEHPYTNKPMQFALNALPRFTAFEKLIEPLSLRA